MSKWNSWLGYTGTLKPVGPTLQELQSVPSKVPNCHKHILTQTKKEQITNHYESSRTLPKVNWPRRSLIEIGGSKTSFHARDPGGRRLDCGQREWWHFLSDPGGPKGGQAPLEAQGVSLLAPKLRHGRQSCFSWILGTGLSGGFFAIRTRSTHCPRPRERCLATVLKNKEAQ